MARDIALEGMLNVRDLGGFRTKSGQLTRSRVFLRGDAPYRISDSARQHIIDSGLTAVIDMRYPHEVAQRPNRFAHVDGVAFEIIPLYVETSFFSMIRQLRDGGSWYCSILDNGGDPIRKIITAMAQADGMCLLHCYLGKDRTGIVTALLLELMGVHEDDIIADYMVTQERLLPVQPELASIRPFFVSKAQFEAIMDTRLDYITTLLQHLHRTHNTAEDYVRSIGVDDAVIAALRQKFLEP
jgi:protein-tyrosine phosphatase